ncbi:hypothetical protein BH20ACI4_BH20ACI4_15530 [soil metagenome]
MIFEGYKKQEFETYGESIGGVLNSMFSVKGGDWTAILKFILALALFGWTVDSILPIIHDAVLWFFNFQPDTFNSREEFPKHFIKLLVPLLLFFLTIVLLYIYRRKNLLNVNYEVTNSTPQKCLVYMLSTYNHKNELSLNEMLSKIENKTLRLDEILATNWGNLAFTVAFHSSVLERCFLVTTKETSSSDEKKLFQKATKLIKYIGETQANRKILCEEENIGEEKEDSNDIGRIANKIKQIYENLDRENYNLTDVVANITGGTSAMSGGMILATLAEDRKIEYVRQGITLTEELLKSGDILLAPKTTFKLTK